MTELGAPDRPPLDLPILEEVGAELQRLFRREELARDPGRVRARGRRSSVRIVTTIAIVLLITTAVAVAAGGLLVGSPVKSEERLAPTIGWGVPIPSTVKLLALSAPDPEGGLPWGLRLIQTTRRLGCLQFGRLIAGRLWVIGRDGAFQDDGRLHQLPTDIFEPQGCASLDAHGRTYLAVGRVAVPASGYAPGCNAPEAPAGATSTRRQCPAHDERALFYGALGPDAKSITYALDGRTVRAATSGPDGAYLIVANARPGADPNIGGPDAPNGSSILPRGGLAQPIRSIEYRGGYVCHIGARGDRDRTGRACVVPGYEPAPLAATAAEVRTPISARLRIRHRPGGAPEDVAQISFTARVAIDRSGEYYDATLVNTCSGGSAGAEPPNDIAAGQRVVMRLDLSPAGGATRPCAGIYRGRVRFVAQPFYFDEEPPSPQHRVAGVTVGEFSIRVP
jgi:hypothetical protein